MTDHDLRDALLRLYGYGDHAVGCPVTHGRKRCSCHLGREIDRFIKAVAE